MKIRMLLMLVALSLLLAACGEDVPQKLEKMTPPKATVEPDEGVKAKAVREEYLKNLKARQAEPTWEQKKLEERGLKRGMSMTEIFEASKKRKDNVVNLKGD